MWYAKDDSARTSGLPQHPVKLLTITTDWDKVDEIFTSQRGEGGKVWRMLPQGGFVKSVKRNHSGAIDTIECANGSLWRFDTVKSWLANPQGAESSDWDAIHVDEPCPEQMFKAAARGLIDRGGSAWFTLTPLREWWINDYFFPQETRGQMREDVWAEQASMKENPTLNAAAIEEYERTLTEDEKQCRLHGIPLNLSGLVYKQFSWDKHVLKSIPEGWASFSEPPKDWPIYFQIDPHPQTPHAVLFCAVSPQGTRFYFTDLFKHTSIAGLAKEIKNVLNGRFALEGRIDPLAYVNDPITETNMAEEFIRCGVIVEKATKALAHGILRVQQELAKETAIRFSPSCVRTLWEMQRYSWDEKDNKPVDKDDHMMECLYRMELLEPVWAEPTKSFAVSDEEILTPSLSLDDLSFMGA